MKKFISDNINLDVFCKNPIKFLEMSNNGSLVILKNKTPVFYVIRPCLFEKIFDIKYNLSDKNDKKQNINQKFAMHLQWIPDKDFIHQAALWGFFLTEEVSKAELLCFINYWQAEGCFFYHIQWQQKLARSLSKSRSLNNYISNKKRDITYIPTPDQTVPHGFRGK
ncbi:DnaT-like ssDNA-binding domain-containing protein [Buchnera aphidicola]|uniref:Replication restart protein DnaT n=1 Tax=Buchnera aphidicola (Artemisaphis artemisicola) TaxID=1241836 RepID=A0A4D6XLJ3_9GAMM|nr:DnaT-like ssDNA-binding domain-containing protein [Buchnera aphidicola]QCI15728.1 primosomal protein DnaI [Buchnera aphidicola (Artemisaphis artemisicola)]